MEITICKVGPLVYAYEIPHREESIKSYDLDGFADYYCFPTDDTYKNLKVDSGLAGKFEYVYSDQDSEAYPWHRSQPFLQRPIDE